MAERQDTSTCISHGKVLYQKEWIHQLVRTFRRGIECPPNPYFSLSHIHSIAFPTTSQLQCKALVLCINMAFDEVTVARPYDPPTDQRGHSRLVTHKVIRWSRKICDYTPSRSVILLATDATVHTGILPSASTTRHIFSKRSSRR